MPPRFATIALEFIAISACVLSPLSARALEVRITGVEAGDEIFQAVENGSRLVELAADRETSNPQDIVAAAQADYGRLLSVLYEAGYFAPVIRITLDGREATAIPSVLPPQRVTRAELSVRPGSRFRFGTVQIGPLAPATTLPEGFARGETAGLSVLKEAATAAIDGWRAEGHAKARLSQQQVTARHAPATLSARLSIRPGPKLHFGALRVEGNVAVRASRILEIAGLPEGAVFSPTELKRAQTRLRRTGAFSAVALIEADRSGPNDSLPITVQLTEAPKRRLGFGGEISSLEGLTLSTFWLHRNLLGGAERLRLEAEIKGIGGASGGEDYTLSARFDRPATFNEDTNFYALAMLAQLDEVNFFSRQLDVETGIERFATDERTYRLGIGLRRAETEDVFGLHQYTLLTLPLGARFDYRDDALDATTGHYIDAGVTPFVALEGADHGVRSYLDARVYRSFGEARPVTFALRGQLGTLHGPSLSTAPSDYLFYSGGGGTVRGQPYQALGVDLGAGGVTGGRSFVGVSAEARFKVTDTIGIVGFFDGGYVGEEALYDGSGTWHAGAGLGVRYDTGLGPIRLDLAVPTSGPETDEKFQIYIGIGQAF